MQKLFHTTTNAIHWFFDTGWNIWSSLFAPIPYGDPYIATVAAMIVIYMAIKTIAPSNRAY